MDALTERNRSWDWLYGRDIPCELRCGKRFPWGEVELQLVVEEGRVARALVRSDAMDWSLPARLERALTGTAFCLEAMGGALLEALPDLPQVGRDLCLMLKEQEI